MAAVPAANNAPLHAPSPATKIRMLTLFLNASALVVRRDGDRKKKTFNQRPYLRLYSNLLQDLNSPDPAMDSNNPDVVLTFANVFYLLRPARVPAFSLSWLELISHRMFMPKCLFIKVRSEPTHAMYKLIASLLWFLEPYLRNADLTDAVRQLYTGTLRLLLVLLHDFPEFLCEYSLALCDAIPSSCIQMRNLILSAFPKTMRLPDPFNPSLRVDNLPELSIAPRVQPEYMLLLDRTPAIKQALEGYLKNRAQASLKQLFMSLTNPANSPEAIRVLQKSGSAYSAPLMNSVVMYLGVEGMKHDQRAQQAYSAVIAAFPSTPAPQPILGSPSYDVFSALITGLDLEGRYMFINAIANHLRYPNSHTRYFSQLILLLFLYARHEVIMEQITRVLLERLIVHRPHPWGLLITFIELIKNPKYHFWDQPFCRCSPDIERLFESVARSCIRPEANSQAPAANSASTKQ
jgi:CCR4-NOT transcription complex subunit 1